MRIFLRCFLFIFALNSAAALAQEFNQPSPNSNPNPNFAGADTTAVPPPSRVRIENKASAAEADRSRATARELGQSGHSGQPGESDDEMRSPYAPMTELSQRPESPEGAQQSRRAPLARKLDERSEFQKFVAESVGQNLDLFGKKFFANAPATFAPVLNAPVPSEYALGPGDELLIRGWGTIDIDYRATIDRNGVISIPSIGTIVLGGVKAGEAQEVVRAAVARLYKGVTINVTFGQLRAITVFVVGQAKRPGSYTVSSLSTLVTTLFASGGPNANGSMRRVQVKRAGKVAVEFDLYAFLAKGDKSADIKLQDGDTIFIPAAAGFVALSGKVNAPAIYELRGQADTIGALLEYAGGVPVVADPRRAFIERVDPSKAKPRSVEQIALDAAGLGTPLRNGDVVNITSITPEFSNAVVLRGNVDQPVRAPFRAGMRVSDLIPSREYLINRKSTERQNDVLHDTELAQESIASRIGGLIEQINWDYAVVERIDHKDLKVELIPFSLGNVFANPAGPDNVLLQPGDTVTIFSQSDVAVPMAKRQIFVRVEGEVNVPGVYQMTAEDTLQSLLARAGGPTSHAYLFGTQFFREQVRKEQEINLQKTADRLENQVRSAQSRRMSNMPQLGDNAELIRAASAAEQERANEAISKLRRLKPQGRIAFGLEPSDRSFSKLPSIKLENGDRLVVPARPDFVHIFGAVNVEASPLWRPNSRVGDYLQVAGMSQDADEEEVFVIRVDGSVVSHDNGTWFSRGIKGLLVMPGDTIVVPEKLDKETAWSKFTKGTREWAKILSDFGIGAAAIKVLKD
jgi:protein involved in polysaccharide export with SLBB domain